VSTSAAKRAWARLIKQVYELDPLVCRAAELATKPALCRSNKDCVT
jgi:hypothetical protein